MMIKSVTFLANFTLIAAILIFVSQIYAKREVFRRPYDHSFFSRIYSNSPYVQGQKATEGIGDDGLYAFSGYYYLMGGDITQVNFENPPLGKYLIGLSILFLGNQNAINIFYAVAIMSVSYLLTLQVTNQRLLASLAILLMIIDPFFQSQILYSLLDLPLTTFFLWGLYFYLLATKRQAPFFLLASFFFGLAISAKFFPVFLMIQALLIIHIWRNHRSRIMIFLLSLTLIPVVYTTSHFNYFNTQHNLWEFLRYQKWILSWRMGNPIMPGNILTSLLIGRYRDWWGKGEWLSYQEWSPIIMILTIVSVLSPLLIKRKMHLFWLLYALEILILFYTAIGTVGYAKYILPVYPIFILLTLVSVRQTINAFKENQRQSKHYG